jgi:outer membrane protein TolC
MRLVLCSAVVFCTVGCGANQQFVNKAATAPRSEPSGPREIRDSTSPAIPVQLVAHQVQPVAAAEPEGTLSIDGKTYRLQLVEESGVNAQLCSFPTQNASPNVATLPLADHVYSSSDQQQFEMLGSVADSQSLPASSYGPTGLFEINLPTALSMVGGQHPAVGFAQARVREAYAQLDQARVLWLPSIQAGLSFHKHDGNYQASNGEIVDVNRNSFQYGLGAGATGAGTTPRPGLVAQFHLADAIFQPEIAEKTAWARGHAANGVLNEQLLNAALAYQNLLNAHQDARILQESVDRANVLLKLTTDFAEAGEGLRADVDRMETEVTLIESRQLAANERIDVASARLAEALSMNIDQPFMPMDPTVVRLELVTADQDKASLISSGLANRPELKESQALVAAACEQYRRQKYAPFVPSLLLGFSSGGFGGGLGTNLDDVDGRYDLDALMTWEVRNLGFGERAARREACSQVEQAKYEKIRVMDQVAREVNEAHAQVTHRGERIIVSQRAIESASKSYERSLSRIRDGQGLPLEALQSVQAMETAKLAYLAAVTDYNEAQFRLQWALGFPVTN